MLLNGGSHSSRHRGQQHHGGVGLAVNNENIMSNPLSRSKTGGIFHDENSFASKRSNSKGGLKKAPLGSSSLSNGSVNKTPSHTGRRRALGDISNRKSASGRPGHGLGVQSAAKPSRSKSVQFKTTPHKSVSGLAAPVSNKTPLGSLPLKSSTKKLSVRRDFPGTSSALTPHRSAGPKRGEFVLPQKKSVSFSIAKQQTGGGGARCHQQSIGVSREIPKAKPVEDIELPAGRLWEEEMRLIPDDRLDISFELDDRDDVHAIMLNERIAMTRAAENRSKEADKALSRNIEKLGLDDMESFMNGLDTSTDTLNHDYTTDLYPDQWESDSSLHCSLIDDDDISINLP